MKNIASPHQSWTRWNNLSPQFQCEAEPVIPTTEEGGKEKEEGIWSQDSMVSLWSLFLHFLIWYLMDHLVF